ncbi:hypothetical protein D3C71_512350 [compost metagenome]
MISKITISKSPAQSRHTIFISVDQFQSGEMVIIEMDNQYYFATYDPENKWYSLQILIPNLFNITSSVPLKGIIYNHEKQLVTDIKKGLVTFNLVSTNKPLQLTPETEIDSKAWTGTLLVKEIKGPFQNNKLVEVIDLTLPVYYLAVPNNNNIHDSQVLSIKWEYQYNNNASTVFKNSKRSVVVENGIKQCKIECQFHNRSDIESITLYAYYQTKSQKVLKRAKTLTKSNTEVTDGSLIWSSKFTAEELAKIVEISKQLLFDPNHLIAAMALETGGTFDPKLVNSLGYTGLIQIGSQAAKDINRRKGTTITSGKEGNLVKMSRLEQLTYVAYYLEPFKGKLNTLGDFYLAILFPVDCGKGNLPDHVVFDKGLALDYDASGKVIKNTKWLRQRAYDQNPVFHKENPEQGKTYVWEITQEIEKWYQKGESTRGAIVVPENTNQSNQNWHDPVENPRSTLYMQSGGGGENGKHWGLFGKTRAGKAHTGLDLFAPTGTKIYACVDGTVYNRRWHGGYGNTLTIKVKDVQAFLKNRKDYKLPFEKDGEILQGINWRDTKEIYLFYAHLHSVNEYRFGDEVACGDVLGTTGRSGVVAGTRAPHLHFEIFCKYVMAVGTRYRINPALFVQYKGYKEQSEAEKNEQEKVKNSGQIVEVNGQVKLNYADMKGFVR